MAPRTDASAESELHRQARRLQWGLAIYLVVLLIVGIGVLRLSFTVRRFDRLTVDRVADSAIEAVAVPDDTAGGVLIPVSDGAR